MTDFYLFKRKWIPIPAFGVLLFGSVQGRDWWHNNSKTKAKVGGVLPGFSLTPLPSPIPKQARGKGGCLNIGRDNLGGELPDHAEECWRYLCPKPPSSLPLPLSLSLSLSLTLAQLQRECCCGGHRGKRFIQGLVMLSPRIPPTPPFSKTS